MLVMIFLIFDNLRGRYFIIKNTLQAWIILTIPTSINDAWPKGIFAKISVTSGDWPYITLIADVIAKRRTDTIKTRFFLSKT